MYDFGLSRKFDFPLKNDELLSMTMNIGTPLYMAPELLECEEKYGSGVDVFAFAIIAYEITTLMKPYDYIKNLTISKLMRKVVNEDCRPQFPEKFNPKMKELISRCRDKKPEKRPSFDEIFDTLSNDFSYSTEEIETISKL